MLQLYLHDFYNIIFKTEHKLYTATGSAPPPKWNILATGLTTDDITLTFNFTDFQISASYTAHAENGNNIILRQKIHATSKWLSN
jgi:hypothetical protein